MQTPDRPKSQESRGRLDGRHQVLPSSHDVQHNLRLPGAHGKGAADVVLAAQHDRRPRGQAGPRGGRAADGAQQRAGGLDIGEQPPRNAGAFHHFIGPGRRRWSNNSVQVATLKSVTMAPQSRKLRKSSISSHLSARAMIAGSCSIIQRMCMAPVIAQGGRPAMAKVRSAPRVRSHHSAWVRSRVLPTDEGVKGRAVGGDGDADHPHARYGNAADRTGIGKLGDGFAAGLGRPAPDLVGVEEEPLGMDRGIRIALPRGREAVARQRPSRSKIMALRLVEPRSMAAMAFMGLCSDLEVGWEE